ncbi:hypothetical protein Rs2_21542 [Raphanus sativus]|nr:hypothetical protein Rs2_21542 [Raphanus sativus]
MGKKRDRHAATVKNPTPRDRDTKETRMLSSDPPRAATETYKTRLTTPKEEASHTYPRLRTSHRISQEQGGSGWDQETEAKSKPRRISPQRCDDTMKNRCIIAPSRLHAPRSFWSEP